MQRAALVFLACCLAATTQAATAVWIDTDPSIGLFLHDADDGFAIVAALRNPDLELRGIGIVPGNASVKTGERIARELATKFPERQVNIFPGKEGRSAGPSAATEALHEALDRQKLTIIALGPMTNLAELLQFHPADSRRIRKIICVAGALPGEKFTVAGWMPYGFHDANFIKDPAAMRKILAQPIPVDFVPFDVGKNLTIAPQEFAKLASGPPSTQWLHRKAKGWASLWTLFGAKNAPLFDALAIVAANKPELIDFRFATTEITPQRLSLKVAPQKSRLRVAVGFQAKARLEFLRLLQP